MWGHKPAIAAYHRVRMHVAVASFCLCANLRLKAASSKSKCIKCIKRIKCIKCDKCDECIQVHSLCMEPSGEASTAVTPLQRDHF